MLLQAPQEDSQLIIRDRFPVPRLVVCDQHGSQVLNPMTLFILHFMSQMCVYVTYVKLCFLLIHL